MNKQCYRVVFNKARGMLMVVSEIAKSQNKSVSNSSRQKRANDTRSEFSPKYKKLVLAVICAQSLVYQQIAWAANTQIQNKSSSVPSSQRALLLKASNGTPIVNIRTPNSKGLSHNTYTQFDIGNNNVILNNSINGSKTRLAGNINGNQYLAKGVAGTILNEVRSSAPSYLKGSIEVAGQKADVIIANPSGIQIQGGGFINANRATLTTGTPIKNKSGELTGFNVAKGVVTLNPKSDNNDALGQAGVKETRANYVDIYARAIDLNGKVYSHKGVDLLAGSNEVDYTTGATKTINPQGTKPKFAIDVSNLGGIYSGGSISLIGTEKGLGVSNAGFISSNRAVRLSNNGNITNTGNIQTNNYPFTAISMNAKGNIENGGSLYSYGLIDLKATGDINHKKAIVKKRKTSKKIYMPQVINMDAGRYLRIDENSDIRNYTVSDNSNINLHADADVYITNKSIIGSNGGINIDADRYVRLKSDGYIFSKKSTNIHSDNGTVVDKAKIYITEGNVNLSAGDNTDSVPSDVYVQNNSVLKATKGDVKLVGERHAVIKSGSQVYQAENVNLYAGGTALIDNARKMNATKNVTLDADGYAYIKNSKTDFTAGEQLTMSGDQASIIGSNLTADKGISVNSNNKQLTIGTSNLTSKDGAVAAIANNAELKISKLTTDAQSTILASKDNLTASYSNISSDSVVINSGKDISLTNVTSKVKNSKETGKLSSYSKGQTNINTSNIDNKGNVNIHSDNRMTIIDTDINAGKSLNLTSKHQIFNNTRRDKKTVDGKTTEFTNVNVNKKQNNFTAGEIVNIDSSWWQTHKDTNIKGSAIALKSGSGHSFSDNINMTATGASTDLNKTTEGRNINGDIQIVNKHYTYLDNRHSLDAKNDIVIQSDKRIQFKNMGVIDAGSVQLKTLKQETLANDKGINNTYGTGDINVINTDINTKKNSDNSLVIDASNYANVIDSNLTSVGSTAIKSNNLMRINNSTIDAGGNLVIDSGHQLITNGKRKAGTNSSLEHVTGKTHLEADKVLSMNSRWWQAHKNTDIKGGAVFINSELSGVSMNDDVNINAQANSKLGADKSAMTTTNKTPRSSLNGDLSISSKKNLTIDPKKVNLKANGDVHLSSREGILTLKGHAGKSGLGSETVVNLTTPGNINLSGKDIVVEGADLTSTKSAINLVAGDGDVLLKGVKDSFTNKVSANKISEVNKRIAEQQEVVDHTKAALVPYARSGLIKKLNTTKDSINNILGNKCYRAINKSAREDDCSYSMEHLSLIYKRITLEKNLETIKQTQEYKDYAKEKNIYDDSVKVINDLKAVLATSKKTSNGFEHKAVSLTAEKDSNIIANKGGILMEGTDINAAKINIKADGNLTTGDSVRITGLADVYTRGDVKNGEITGPNYSYHQLINQAKLNAKKDINIAGKGNLAQKGINNAVIVNSADINAGNNVNIDAIKGDLLLESSQVAFMDGSRHTSTSRKWYGKKKRKTTTRVTDNRNAVTTDINARNISLKSDGDIKVYGSELKAKDNGKVDIEAGKALYLYAIKDKKYSKTDVKKRSSWFGIRYSKDHTNDTHQEISQLPATLIGGKAYTKSGGDTLLQGTVFDTLKPADIQVGVGKYADKDAKLILEPITSQVQKTHLQEKESIVWQKQVNSGSVVTTADMPKFNQTPTITSANGIEITVPVEVTVKDNQKAKTRILSQNDLGKIAVELSKKPGYEYLADLDKRNDINWKQVELIQKNWHYEQEGLTPAAAALIAIAVTIAVGGMDGGGIATSLLSFTEGTVSAAAANAGLASLASQASVILINNKGDISQTLDDLATSDVARKMATAALTAGIGAELNIPDMGSKFGNDLANGVANGVTNALVDSAINGTSLEEALTNSLKSSMIDALAASTYTYGTKKIDLDGTDIEAFARNLAHKVAAAGVGCLAADAKGQECSSGALGAAVGEMVGDFMVELGTEGKFILNPDELQDVIHLAQITAGTVALLAGEDVDMAASSAAQAVKNNAGQCMGSDQYCYRNLSFSLKGVTAHEHFNDMTILSGNFGMLGKTVVINNKNGNVYVPVFADFDVAVRGLGVDDLVNTTKVLTSSGVSINFGSIVGGYKTASEIDEVIKGSSVGFQACDALCGGLSKTKGANGHWIVTYGIGTPQAGMTGGKMQYAFTISKNGLQQILNKDYGANQ